MSALKPTENPFIGLNTVYQSKSSEENNNDCGKPSSSVARTILASIPASTFSEENSAFTSLYAPANVEESLETFTISLPISFENVSEGVFSFVKAENTQAEVTATTVTIFLKDSFYTFLLVFYNYS